MNITHTCTISKTVSSFWSLILSIKCKTWLYRYKVSFALPSDGSAIGRKIMSFFIRPFYKVCIVVIMVDGAIWWGRLGNYSGCGVSLPVACSGGLGWLSTIAERIRSKKKYINRIDPLFEAMEQAYLLFISLLYVALFWWNPALFSSGRLKSYVWYS